MYISACYPFWIPREVGTFYHRQTIVMATQRREESIPASSSVPMLGSDEKDCFQAVPCLESTRVWKRWKGENNSYCLLVHRLNPRLHNASQNSWDAEINNSILISKLWYTRPSTAQLYILFFECLNNEVSNCHFLLSLKSERTVWTETQNKDLRPKKVGKKSN